MLNILTTVFLIIRIVSNPIANVFQKKLSDKISSYVINMYSYLFLSLITISFIPKYILNIDYDYKLTGLIILAGLLCILGTSCTIKAVNIGELSVLGPINSYKSIIGLISAIFLLKEYPSFTGIIGIVLIIWGSRYIFETTKEGFSFNIFKRKDIQLRFSALILTGIEAAILKKIILLTSVEACMIYWCICGFLWSFIFAIITKKQILPKAQNFGIYIIIIGICLGLMQYSTNYVFSNMNVGYALALFQLSSIITVIFGYKFFNEKNITRKLIGTVTMLLGSVLIILF